MMGERRLQEDAINQQALEDERTAQRLYRRKVQEEARKPVNYSAPANTVYTQDSRPRTGSLPEGLLIGRILLAESHSCLNGRRDFYIGDRHAKLDGIEVFSWAAPVACTFFRGENHHSWCDEVLLIRSFGHDGDQISGLVDDVVSEPAPTTSFPKRGLSIPLVPDRPNLRLDTSREQNLAPTPLDHSVRGLPSDLEDTDDLLPASQESATAPALPDSAPPRDTRAAPPIRAEDLLRARMAAPRTRSLTPVLATLQPDQYALVTRPAMRSVIIEGHPGTGKTIVATHRAAYMVNDSSPARNELSGNVLLIGPTKEYCAHVRKVVGGLSGNSPRLLVRSMPELMHEILDLREEPKGPSSRLWQDVDAKLALTVRSSITRLRNKLSATPTSRETFEYLRTEAANKLPADQVEDWAQYLRSLPPFEEALTYRSHTPLLAFIRWEVAKPRKLTGIEHIIVDEAQDVHPLEWMLLREMNEEDSWTIIGDLNQRRSDHTLASWRLVTDILAVPKGDPDVCRLERGYRSTKAILEFANRLLPRNERELLAFQQDGPGPKITRVRPTEVDDAVLAEINRLQSIYPQGTVAVITVDPTGVRRHLGIAGWATESGRVWNKDGRQVTVVHPDTARGLEFDAVVVKEPSAFPKNFGRRGLLYTALTRPNRELAIVHSTALPAELSERWRP